MTGSCDASKKMGRRKSVHLSSAGKKSSLTMMKRNRKRKRIKRTEEGTSRAERMIQVMVEAGNIKMATSEDHASCLLHKDLIVTTKQIQALLTAARASGGKEECND